MHDVLVAKVCMLVIAVLQIVAVVFKFAGIMSCSWGVVFIPLFASIAVTIVIGIVATIAACGL